MTQTCYPGENEIPAAAEVLCEAFFNDPMMGYFFSSEKKRKLQLTAFYRFLLRYGQLYGKVVAVPPKLDAVAIWLPQERPFMNTWREIHSGVLAFIAEAGLGPLFRLMRMNGYLVSAHHANAPAPHWYLLAIGVRPRSQRQGLGSGLMSAFMQEHVKLSGCYLETMRDTLTGYYERFGFTVKQKARTAAGLTLISMFRPAGRTGETA